MYKVSRIPLSKSTAIATALILLMVLPMMLIVPVMAQSITLNPNIGPPNTRVTVSGSGFIAHYKVEIWFDRNGNGLVDRATDTQLGDDVTTEKGEFSVDRNIPTDASPGTTHIMVIADGGEGAPLASAVFTVTTVSVTLTPNIGPPGTSVTVTGSGFTPNRRYQIFFDPTGVNVLVVDFTALPDGSMPLSKFTVPDDTAGAKDVVVNEYGGTLIIYKTIFTVTTSMTLEPESGPAGLTVHVTVRGLPSDVSSIDIYFDRDGDGKVDAVTGGDTILGTTTVTDGKAEHDVSIPGDATPNSYAIMVIQHGATGENLEPIISRTYTVIPPTITLPVISRGPVGAKFRVAGEGFSVGASYDIYFDMDSNNIVSPGDAKLKTVQAGSDGKFTEDVNVPTTASPGIHKVMVVPKDATSPILATADFLVTVPQITLSPNIGPVGVTVTVTGTGFTPHSTVAGFEIEVKIYVDKDRSGSFETGEVMTTTPATINPDENGEFTATFTFPDVTAGYTYSVRAIESVNTLAYADALFTVPSPVITLTPNYGTPGETITVTGINFKISKAVTVYMDKDMDGTFDDDEVVVTPLPSTDGTGHFSAEFTIPPVTPGLYVVRAYDGVNYDDATLTVATPETMAIVAAISDVKSEVESIENTLKAGGDFYMFVHTWFTLIDNKLGTFTGTDTVASLLYAIEGKLDKLPAFGDLVTKNWADLTGYIDGAKSAIIGAVSDVQGKLDKLVIDEDKSGVPDFIEKISSIYTWLTTDANIVDDSELAAAKGEIINAIQGISVKAAQATSGSGSTTFTSSSSVVIYSGSKVGTVTVSIRAPNVGYGERLVIRYYLDGSNYIEKVVTSGRSTTGWTDTAAAMKVELVYTWSSGTDTVYWAYSVIYPPN
jgi:hypothetical protein